MTEATHAAAYDSYRQVKSSNMNWRNSWRALAAVILLAIATPYHKVSAQETKSDTSTPQAEQKSKSKKKSKQERAQEAEALLQARAAARQAMEKLMPLVSVEESNPWTGDGGPILALYADGTLIYWLPHERGGQYRIAHLSDTEISEFFKRVDVDELPRSNQKSYFPSVPIRVALDAAMFSVSVRQPDRTWRYINLFGSLHGAAPGSTKGLSPELNAVLDFLATYEHPNATEWVPEKIEITFWPAVKMDEPAAAWPAGIPSLEAALFNKENGSYTLLLTREQYAQLRLIWEPKPDQNFRIGEKLWRVYVYYPFPHMQTLLQRYLSRP